MSTTDWRGLCEDLVKAAENLYKQSITQPHFQVIELSNGRHPIPLGLDVMAQDAAIGHLLDRTRALLSQPKPEEVGPTLEQVSDWITKCSQKPEENKWTRRIDHHDALAIAKAALYDWGRPAPAPLLVDTADAVATVMSEVLFLLTQHCGKILTPDLVEQLHKEIRDYIDGLLAAIAADRASRPAPAAAEGEVEELVQEPIELPGWCRD